ncbi:hypothetical protein TRIP_B350009 [uncultured Desulfatiglans sp.]|nr:hypothetical protein TRIP_B350009 [uncultured Desulfatiglans sp.]
MIYDRDLSKKKDSRPGGLETPTRSAGLHTCESRRNHRGIEARLSVHILLPRLKLGQSVVLGELAKSITSTLLFVGDEPFERLALSVGRAKADLLTESYPIVLTDAVKSETIFSSGRDNLQTRRVENIGSADSEGIKEFWSILYDHFKNAKAHETYINSALDNDLCKIKNLSKKCHNILE